MIERRLRRLGMTAIKSFHVLPVRLDPYLAFALLAAVDSLDKCCNLFIDKSVYLRLVNDRLLDKRLMV